MLGFKALARQFTYEDFSIESKKNRIVFFYTTDAGHAFTHELTFAFPKGANEVNLRPAVFALGMAELAHYWKAILAPEIVVKAGALTPEQCAFWENIYLKGLGEFFYVNKIDFRNITRVITDPDAPTITHASRTLHGVLVPFGGGKDSLVTGELLKQQNKAFSWFELEPLPFASSLQEVSGIIASVQVGRNVTKNFGPVMELVAQGAPNGHVPITATYMFSAALVASAYGFQDVVLSLERSANEGNVEYLGMEVNHQYSKSFEFEQQAAQYVRKHINPNMRLFSLVRPLYELQIVQKFTRHPQYFQFFISCNRGLKHGSWCGKCAKCAFMFAALSAFLPRKTVVEVFMKDLFEDVELIPLYEALIGMHAEKPFDCVGTYSENMLALYLAGKRYSEADEALPPVLAALPIEKGAAHMSLLDERGPDIIPTDYQKP